METQGFHDLLSRAQAGDRAAMDRLLEILRPHLEPLARQYADPERAVESTADLLQESCLRAWQKLDKFDSDKGDDETFAMFRAWVGQIVRNLGLDRRRARGRLRRKPAGGIVRLGDGAGGDGTHAGVPSDPPGRESTPSTYVRADETSARVRAALEEIEDTTSASILRMYFFEEMTFADIARRLELSYDQVRDRYWATMRDLGRRFREEL